MTRIEFIQRVTAIADELKLWKDDAVPAALTTNDSSSGEHACAIFFRTFGQRQYVWEELPDLERKAWEDVAATLGRGAGSVSAESLENGARVKEREGCATEIDGLLRETGQAHAQILVHAAARIRARR